MQTSSSRKYLENWMTHCVILCVLTILAALFYFLWSPGFDIQDGRYDLKANGLWMQHGWLGDNSWFIENKKEPKTFRDASLLKQTAERLRNAHIKDAFPHLCPATKDGQIASTDDIQIERFLDNFHGFRIMPWVGGVNKDTVFLHDVRWRKTFAKSCANILEKHSRLAGIHVNIEPLRSGNSDYLLLLQELRDQIPEGKLISIAAYPPPTFWQQNADVHWDESYSRRVAALVDQAVIMMYDTSLRSPGLYEQQVKDWTHDVLSWYSPKQVLLGVPAYDDAGVGYHDPETENLLHSLRGINAGLGEKPPNSYQGICIYSDWQMTKSKWDEYNKMFCSQTHTD